MKIDRPSFVTDFSRPSSVGELKPKRSNVIDGGTTRPRTTLNDSRFLVNVYVSWADRDARHALLQCGAVTSVLVHYLPQNKFVFICLF